MCIRDSVHGAHGVEDGDYGHAHVAEDGEPHVGDAEGGKYQDAVSYTHLDVYKRQVRDQHA